MPQPLCSPTLDQLRALKLDGMAQAFVELEAQEDGRDLAHAEWFALLLDREAADRNTAVESEAEEAYARPVTVVEGWLNGSSSWLPPPTILFVSRRSRR